MVRPNRCIKICKIIKNLLKKIYDENNLVFKVRAQGEDLVLLSVDKYQYFRSMLFSFPYLLTLWWETENIRIVHITYLLWYIYNRWKDKVFYKVYNLLIINKDIYMLAWIVT